MQSKSTFPARIAPFSGEWKRFRDEKGAIRAETWTYTLHCCISITEEVKINDLQKSIVFTLKNCTRYQSMHFYG